MRHSKKRSTSRTAVLTAALVAVGVLGGVGAVVGSGNGGGYLVPTAEARPNTDGESQTWGPGSWRRSLDRWRRGQDRDVRRHRQTAAAVAPSSAATTTTSSTMPTSTTASGATTRTTSSATSGTIPSTNSGTTSNTTSSTIKSPVASTATQVPSTRSTQAPTPTSQATTPSTTTAQAPAPRPAPSTSASTTTPPAAPPAAPPAGTGTAPAPGTVGYRGPVSALTVIDSPANAPAGTKWTGGILSVSARDLVLDGVYVKGGIEFNGSGTLTIRNSIIEGGGSWMVVVGFANGCNLDISNSTLRWKAGSTPPQGIGAGAIHGYCKLRAVGNDISGTPDGIQLGEGNSLIEGNWIHDLALLGRYPNNTHNDGIQLYGGSGIVIRNNRIDIGWDGEHQNGAIFFQGRFTAPVIAGNWLSGGGYTFRIETNTTGAVVTDNTILKAGNAWGEVLVEPQTVGTWSGNVNGNGRTIPRP